MGKKRRYSEVVALMDGFRVGETKTKKIPQLVVPLKVVGCADKSRLGEEVTLYQIVNLENDDSVTWAVEAMRNLGMSNTNIFKPEGLGSIKASLCEEWEVYEGNGKWRPRFINPIKAQESISGDAADAFSAALEAALSNTPAVEVTSANEAPETLPEATSFDPQTFSGDGEEMDDDLWS